MTTDTLVTARTTPQTTSSWTTPSGTTILARLVRRELRLVLREPIVLAFVFAFPVITVLVVAGAFTAEDAPDFGGVDPSHWYVSSYLSVIIAAVGLVMLPVHVASYRERGVLRRFAAAGFLRWSFAVASIVVGVVLTLVGSAVMLAVAAPVYGVPAVESPVRAVLAVLVGAAAFTSIGLLIGSLVPNARAAQGIGLLAFFPSFLLGGGGPPPSVMGDGLRRAADVLPLTHVTQSIREPWLGIGTGTTHLAITLAVLAVSALGWWRAVRL
jgi:ABC-2 type transport system permease protein